jgi:tetratricopeptide (TPR) repeat protein
MNGKTLLFSCALLLAAGAARADTPPGAWDMARDPDARARWSLHVRVERMLSPARNDDGAAPDPRLDAELRLEAARAMLEKEDAAHSPDVRLRFDLGIVYYELGDRQGGKLDLFQKAVDLLAPAVDAAPYEPAATEAFAVLVLAYAKMNRARDELATWRRYIPLIVDDSDRVGSMMNMGEAEMRLGHVDDALGTFREILRLCGELPNTGNNGRTYVLTLWDLAIALDRSGDPGEALDAAAKASRMRVIGSRGNVVTGAGLIASDPSVFFVPAWELEWYLALGASAEARDAKDARDAAGHWAGAVKHWDAYVERSSAEGGQDLFLEIARVRQAHAHARVLVAEKAAAKLPKRPRPVGVEP